jgi:hypothetical protein
MKYGSASAGYRDFNAPRGETIYGSRVGGATDPKCYPSADSWRPDSGYMYWGCRVAEPCRRAAAPPQLG